MQGSIDWSDMLGSSFIKLDAGVPKKLILKNWHPQVNFKDDKTKEVKKGIEFDVYGEDGQVYDENSKKTYTVTAIKALVKLRPIIEKAEASGLDWIKVSVIRVGEGKNTQYEVTELKV
jgi:hypothetical protein